ncbi:MAG: NAD-binding protein, partial [Planctomycetota bacterium]
IDRLLSLEHLAAMELARGIRDPSSVIVEQYARGGMEVHEVVVYTEGKATRCKLKELNLPTGVRLATIRRGNRMWIAGAEDQLEVGDSVIIFSRHEDMKKVKSIFRTSSVAKKRIVIAGGGEIGLHLARTLEREGYMITVMDSDAERCKLLAKILDNTAIIHCDATQREHLEEERVGNVDVFAACTGDDEDNIMMAVEAKDLGAQQVLTMIDRPNYSNITSKLGIDFTVTQKSVMARQVLAYLTEGAIISRAKLPGGLINILELDVMPGSPITTGTLAELGLPDRCLVAAIGNQDTFRVPGGNDRIQGSDTAIIIVEEDVMDAALAFFNT